MPLIRDNGISAHSWRPVADDEPLDLRGFVIVPLARLEEALDAQDGGPLGVALANTDAIDEIIAKSDLIDLVTIDFPAFSDGRGFSLARRLRAAGYEGDLWASGKLIADQYGFARACGFDAVLIDETVFQRQPESDWLDAAASQSLTYQSGLEPWMAGPSSILELRRGRAMSLAAE